VQAAYRDARADLDFLGLRRHCRHGDKQVRAQERAVRYPATRKAQPLAMLGVIKGGDVADTDAEFHDATL
jgi:hypothetical protein